MRRHIRDVLASGDESVAVYIVRWMAWKLQNPGLHTETVIVNRGEEGTGKGVVWNGYASIFGPHAIHVTKPELFATGRFNAHLRDRVFLFADECYWPGNRAHEGALKGLITERELTFESKGVDAQTATNMLGSVLSTNDEWAVPAGPQARRFVVTDVASKYRGNHEYFNALFRERDRGGLAAMAYDLLRLNLGDWHPRQIVHTAALDAQKEHSLRAEDRLVRGLLEAGSLPNGGAWIASSALEDMMRAQGIRGSVRVLPLRKVGAEPKADATKTTRGWQFPPLREARAKWDRAYWAHDWDDPDNAAEWRPPATVPYAPALHAPN